MYPHELIKACGTYRGEGLDLIKTFGIGALGH
jgi:hypothetical protein